MGKSLLPLIFMVLTSAGFSQPIETNDQPFNYSAARTSFTASNGVTDAIAGAPGGFWGCWLREWQGGCYWWPPHDGCQNVEIKNDLGELKKEIVSLGPDEGTKCNVYGEYDCKGVLWPYRDRKRTVDDSFRFPGNHDAPQSVMSFKCWKG